MLSAMLWYAMVWYDEWDSMRLYANVWNFNAMLWNVHAMLWGFNVMLCYGVCSKIYDWTDCNCLSGEANTYI